MRLLITLLLISACTVSPAQLKPSMLSGPEKRWVIKHPFAARKAKKITAEVIAWCDSLARTDTLTGNDLNGGRLDALRHAYWMARLCSVMKPWKAYSLGVAHEKGNKKQFKKRKTEDGGGIDSMMTVMDLVNNQIGIEIGAWTAWNEASGEYSLDKVRKLVIERLKKGELRILLKDKEGYFLSCDGKRVDLSLYKGKWAVPKCLVRSDVRSP